MPAIEVSHVTKEYRLGTLQGLKQTALNAGRRLLGRPVEERPLFKALDDVSFSIEPGEVVGMSKKEVDRKFDEIVDFAEMAEFIDTPVKRYSSFGHPSTTLSTVLGPIFAKEIDHAHLIPVIP